MGWVCTVRGDTKSRVRCPTGRQPGSGERWVQDASGDRRQVDRLGVQSSAVARRASALLSLRCVPRQVDILAAACGDARAWQTIFQFADVSARGR